MELSYVPVEEPTAILETRERCFSRWEISSHNNAPLELWPQSDCGFGSPTVNINHLHNRSHGMTDPMSLSY